MPIHPAQKPWDASPGTRDRAERAIAVGRDRASANEALRASVAALRARGDEVPRRASPRASIAPPARSPRTPRASSSSSSSRHRDRYRALGPGATEKLRALRAVLSSSSPRAGDGDDDDDDDDDDDRFRFPSSSTPPPPSSRPRASAGGSVFRPPDASRVERLERLERAGAGAGPTPPLATARRRAAAAPRASAPAPAAAGGRAPAGGSTRRAAAVTAERALEEVLIDATRVAREAADARARIRALERALGIARDAVARDRDGGVRGGGGGAADVFSSRVQGGSGRARGSGSGSGSGPGSARVDDATARELATAIAHARAREREMFRVVEDAAKALSDAERDRRVLVTLVPIRPRRRGERRSLRTKILPGASLRPPLLAGFNPDTPRCLSTPSSDAFRLESHCFPYDRVGVVNFIP